MGFCSLRLSIFLSFVPSDMYDLRIHRRCWYSAKTSDFCSGGSWLEFGLCLEDVLVSVG
jgi:hypothetical protein